MTGPGPEEMIDKDAQDLVQIPAGIVNRLALLICMSVLTYSLTKL